MSTVEKERTETQMPEVLDPRVERGAALLDEKMPGWADRINLETLDTGGIKHCVLGQLYGHFGKGALAVWGLDGFGDRTDLFRAHGFYTFHKDDDYDSVQQNWRLAILARRTSA